jgi:hypothetical protein
MRITVIFASLLLSVSALASNPQIRTCRQLRAQFTELIVTSPVADRVGFCNFDQSSIIDAISIMSYLYESKTTEAVAAFKSTADKPVKSCLEVGAVNASSFNNAPMVKKLCYFADESFIEIETLKRGYAHPWNAALVEAIEAQ